MKINPLSASIISLKNAITHNVAEPELRTIIDTHEANRTEAQTVYLQNYLESEASKV
jgi:hypothetical protein